MKAVAPYQTFRWHSSTFSGGSLACAAGLAMLRVLRDGPQLVRRHPPPESSFAGEGLEAIARSSPILREVRGHG